MASRTTLFTFALTAALLMPVVRVSAQAASATQAATGATSTTATDKTEKTDKTDKTQKTTAAAKLEAIPDTTDPSLPREVAARLDAGLAETDRLREAKDYPAARARYEALAREAEAAGATRHQAGALWAVGLVRALANENADAKAAHEQAAALYRTLDHRPGEASATRHLGVDLWYLGDVPASRKAAERALALYQELRDPKGLALTHGNLLYMMPAGAEKSAIREQALRYAREAGEQPSLCNIQHEWGDELLVKDDFVGARVKLREALGCFEALGERSRTGRVLTSLGRLERAHGQYQAALDYYTRALALQQGENTGNDAAAFAAIQTINAMANTLQLMGRMDDAQALYTRALADARALKADLWIRFMETQFGAHYLARREFEKAIPLLEAALQTNLSASAMALRCRQLARAYHGIGNLTRAQEYADRALAAASKATSSDFLSHALHARAEIARARGDLDAAERDLREAIGHVERVRATIVPLDFMKRGFSDLNQELYTSTIELLLQRERPDQALEVAERARGRAFLDLLATRDANLDAGQLAARGGTPRAPGTVTGSRPGAAGAAGTACAGVAGADAAAGASATGATTALRLRGGESASGSAGESGTGSASAGGDTGAGGNTGTRGSSAATLAGLAPNRGGPRLALDSSSSAAPATTAEMVATAKRLRSTLVAYWVGPDDTIAWVVSANGTVRARKIDVPAVRLEALVAEANRTVGGVSGTGLSVTSPSGTGVSATGVSGSGVSGNVSGAGASGTAASGTASGSGAGSPGPGSGFAMTGGSQRRPWRELYGYLVKPIRADLPSAPDSLLTIVPHGPLFHVSFAALLDEQGRYLVERYRLHYTPAIGILSFIAPLGRDSAPAARQTASRALLVGDPGELTPQPGEDPLPALPWARREVEAIATQLTATSSDSMRRTRSGATSGATPAAAAPEGAGTRVLVDASATESAVRTGLAGMDILHFATHSVVDRQQALSSYIALRGDAVDAGSDGRLTAEEVYGLNLQARLVVLSACSTAVGPMTGDGIIGFTRAFLYAGASSVIATDWDVPDEAGYELMRRFYRARARTGRESDALRTAQLGMLRTLRAGTLKVKTSAGEVALPEHPMLWAGFILVGEP